MPTDQDTIIGDVKAEIQDELAASGTHLRTP